MKTTHEAFATPFLVMPPKKATNVTLSDRAKAIAKVLATKDGSNVSRVLEGLLLSELARGGRLTDREVQEEIERLRGEGPKDSRS